MFRKRPTTQSLPAAAAQPSNGGVGGSRASVEVASQHVLPLHQNHHHHSASCSHHNSVASTTTAKHNGSSAAPNINSHTDTDNKYAKKRTRWRQKQQQERRLLFVTLVIAALYALKRCCFPLSHDALNRVDSLVRRLWLAAEQSGVLTKFPPYQTSVDYHEHFPYFSLLEQHYMTIRSEALALLQHNRQSIPRLKDLVESKRAAGKVYATDWKTCTYVCVCSGERQWPESLQ
jgi:hypothetical protein